MSDKALDPEVIEQLSALVDEDDPDFLLDLLNSFLESAESSFKELDSAIKIVDTSKVEMTAHTLKGASSNIGATQMAVLYKQLEEMAKTDTITGASEIVIKLETEFEQVKREVKIIS